MQNIALLIATFVVLTLVWKQLLLCTVLLALLAAIRLARERNVGTIGMYLFGFVFASLAEIVQVAAGLYTYAQHSSLVIPAYNFFLWGAVLLGAQTIVQQLEHRTASPTFTPTTKQMLAEQALYLGITAVLCLAAKHQTAVAALFAVMLLLRLAIFSQQNDLVFAMVGLFLGPLAEAWLVGRGIYHFDAPRIGNLPLWHPLYWSLIVLFLRRLFSFAAALTHTASLETLRASLPSASETS